MEKIASNTKVLISALLMLFLLACHKQDTNMKSSAEPTLSPDIYFQGKSYGVGFVQDRFGKIRRSFTVSLIGNFDESGGTLAEEFHWSDGEIEKRIWTLRKINENSWKATAPDIIGEATGVIEGNLLKWNYVLKVPIGERRIAMKFDDQMMLFEDGILVNRASFSKFGIHLGDVLVSFSKAAL